MGDEVRGVWVGKIGESEEGMNDNQKCHMTSNPDCHLCAAMDRALGDRYGPGFWPYVLTNFETGEDRMVGIVLTRSKSKKEQPLLLNFCPFCGERMLTDDGKPFFDEATT